MIQDLKKICNLIVGEWYCEDNSQKIIFDLNDNLLRTSKMTILDFKSPKIEINYGIAILPDLDKKGNFQFYIEINGFPKQCFLIKSITQYKLLLDPLVNFIPQRKEILYSRRIDVKFSEQLLKGL